MMRHLRSLTLSELQSLVRDMCQPDFRAKQIFEWCGRPIRSIADMSNLPAQLRESLAERFVLPPPQLLRKQRSEQDGTTKYLWGLADGNAVECVLMRYRHGSSLCISTQVGCRMGCTFCASTEGGLIRNLEAGEMLDQVLHSGTESGLRIDSLVLMGTGEPLDNYDHVMRFVRLVSDPQGIGLGVRHISISTCGLVPAMLRLAEEGLPITLSVSLHAPSQKLRADIMPVARTYPLDQVVVAARSFAKKTGRKVYFEYTLIRGVNDSDIHARQLAQLVKGFLCHVNLIPLNPVAGKPAQPPTAQAVRAFAGVLAREHVSCTVRRKLGDDIDAACGQLRAAHQIQEENEKV